MQRQVLNPNPTLMRTRTHIQNISPGMQLAIQRIGRRQGFDRSSHHPLRDKDGATTERITQPYLWGWPVFSGRVAARLNSSVVSSTVLLGVVLTAARVLPLKAA